MKCFKSTVARGGGTPPQDVLRIWNETAPPDLFAPERDTRSAPVKRAWWLPVPHVDSTKPYVDPLARQNADAKLEPVCDCQALDRVKHIRAGLEGAYAPRIAVAAMSRVHVQFVARTWHPTDPRRAAAPVKAPLRLPRIGFLRERGLVPGAPVGRVTTSMMARC